MSIILSLYECLRRVGLYYYETPQGKEKIVPMVDIYDE